MLAAVRVNPRCADDAYASQAYPLPAAPVVRAGHRRQSMI
jgi:hypothetical protein